jgi:hypothetical protein
MEQVTQTIDDLAIELFHARAAEAKAKEERIRIEEAIVAQIDTADKGSQTLTTGNGLKITIKTDLGYKADVDAIERIDSDLVKVTEKRELNVKAYEELKTRDPDLYARVAEHVSVEPRKPSVTLKTI